MRPTIMEIDLNAFVHNVKQIQKYIGNTNQIMPVIKANAYGTYINFRNDMINQFDIVAVALVEEGVALRKNGYSKEIFVLNQPSKDEIPEIIENHLTIGVSEISFIEALGNLKEKVKVHIEIDTGMGRTGIQPEEVTALIQKVKSYENFEIEGIYTHLSSADFDEEYTNEQLRKFKIAVDEAIAICGDLKYIHCNASNGIINYLHSPILKECCNLVRAGIILYGYDSCDGACEKLDLKPVCKLKSQITFLKEVEKGTSIGYSRSYITNQKMKIATIPIGYADGLRRAMSNGGIVAINGVRVPIVGKVCMDGFMADVSNVPNVKVGDEAYIWDNQTVTLEEVAKKCDTINYEIMSSIMERVVRKFHSS